MKYTNEERVKYARSHRDIKVPNKIHPSAKIHRSACIGKDGFGYARQEDGSLIKMPHQSNVIIEKDVEIGAHTCIDRGVSTPTIIGEGTKIDNLVHIAHGVKIGKHCVIVANSVIGGSVEIGDRCFIGIGAMIKNKVKIGNRVVVGMGSVVTKDIPDGETWYGNPALKDGKITISKQELKEINESISIRRSS